VHFDWHGMVSHSVFFYKVTPQFSVGKHHSTTTLNYIQAYNLQTEFKELHFIKEYATWVRAEPIKICKIIEKFFILL
jgi:hypothetical protein